MNERKKHIIETAIDSFAKKGFYSTSIQEIADASGVSKGSVYLHFRSKDELLLEIFRYYFGRIQEKILRVEDEKLPPKENFKRQFLVQFEEMMNHKDFLIMHFREQTHSTNQEVSQLLWRMKHETLKRYESHLLHIYGEKVEPYVIDGSLLLDGMKNAYFRMLMFNDFEIELSSLASFIIRRLDDLILGMLKEQERPMMTKEMLKPLFQKVKSHEEELIRDLREHLKEMEQILESSAMEEGKKASLKGSLDLMKEEIGKPDPKKFLIQGMLSNFKSIEAFNKTRRYIADRLDLES